MYTKCCKAKSNEYDLKAKKKKKNAEEEAEADNKKKVCFEKRSCNTCLLCQQLKDTKIFHTKPRSR